MEEEKLRIKILEIIRDSNGGIFLIDLIEELKKLNVIPKGYLNSKNIIKELLIKMETNGEIEERLYAEGDWRGKVDYDLYSKGAEVLKSIGQKAPFIIKLRK